MTPALEVAVAVVTLVVGLANLGALFYGGGRIVEQVKTLGDEVARLRDWRHDEVAQDLTVLKLASGVHAERLDAVDLEIGRLRQRRAGP